VRYSQMQLCSRFARMGMQVQYVTYRLTKKTRFMQSIESITTIRESMKSIKFTSLFSVSKTCITSFLTALSPFHNIFYETGLMLLKRPFSPLYDVLDRGLET